MNFSNYKFTLDLQSNISQVSLPVRLNDSGRRLFISLTDGGNQYTLSEGSTAKFFFLKPENDNGVREGGIYDCTLEDNYSTLQLDLSSDVTNVSGVVDCEIRLYGPNGRLITSPSFILVVDDRVMGDDDVPLTEQQISAIDAILISEAERIEAEKNREEAVEIAVTNANDAADTANEIVETLTQKLDAGEFNGEDGVSVTHEWDGTTLIISSASGTSSADLKGEPGEPGDSNLHVYEAQAPQEDGTFAIEIGKEYTVFAPNANGKFTCTINLVGRYWNTDHSPSEWIDNDYTLASNIPCENNAESFAFELLSFEHNMGTYYYSYRIDNTIFNKDYYAGSYAEIYSYGYISGATKVGIPTYEVFITPDPESGADGKDGKDGEDGATFTPSVSADGVLSWTNNKGLENPAPINIKGADGKDGVGKDGVDGKSAYEIALDNGFEGTEAEWLGSLVGADGKDGVDGVGKDGRDGVDGKDGTSVTVSSVSESNTDGGSNVVTFSDGKTLTVKNGGKGSSGERGFSILKITKAPTEYTTETGGFTPSYRVALSTVLTQSKADKVLVGDTLAYSYYQYPIGYVDSSYVYVGARVSIRGSTGSAGADGYTPQREVDYWTPADQEAIVQQVIAALGTPVFGRVDENNNIILSGNLVEGSYSVKYEDSEGNLTNIGNIELADAPAYTNLFSTYTVHRDKRTSSSAGSPWLTDCVGAIVVIIPFGDIMGKTLRIKAPNIAAKTSDGKATGFYAMSNKEFLGYVFNTTNGNLSGASCAVNEGNNTYAFAINDENVVAPYTSTAWMYTNIVINTSGTAVTDEELAQVVITVDEPIVD